MIVKLTSDKYYLFYDDDNVVDYHASVICVSSEIYLLRIKDLPVVRIKL